MIEELTDLAMIDGSQVADNASVLIIKNNIKLISKVFFLHQFEIDPTLGIPIIVFDSIRRLSRRYILQKAIQSPAYCDSFRLRSSQQVRFPSLHSAYASRFSSYTVMSSVDSLQQIDVMDAGNQISLLSYLLHTYFLFPDNQANESLLIEMLASNVLVSDAVINHTRSSGKYLLQIFAKAIFAKNPDGEINRNFVRASDIYLLCCKVGIEKRNVRDSKIPPFSKRYP